MSIHTIDDLRQRQALPLEVKIRMSEQRIREWVYEFGLEGVYISFSGGKDSTALLHLARRLYPDIKAVFVDTGLEYPEIREFVKTFDNVDVVRPKLTFKQVIQKYGYPFISKEVSQQVYEAIKGAEKNHIKPRQTNTYKRKFDPNSEYIKRFPRFSLEKYDYLFDAPFVMSHKCCAIMKKAPAKAYEKKTGRRAILATMTDESRLRETEWLKNGCNAFNSPRPTSKPFSFWTEQDILTYIKQNNITICSVYGDIVPDNTARDALAGQLDIADYGLINDTRPLKTTGCSRTGCMFCGFGCHLEKEGEGRFERMKITHPKQYDYIMRPADRGGLDYKNIIDWLNTNGHLNIRY